MQPILVVVTVHRRHTVDQITVAHMTITEAAAVVVHMERRCRVVERRSAAVALVLHM
jgi:hypothetical protein